MALVPMSLSEANTRTIVDATVVLSDIAIG